MGASQHMLLISGSLRAASTNTAVLRTVQAVAPDGLTAVLYDGIETLPHFNPDDDAEGRPPPSVVAGLRAQIAAADAVLFSPPEYAGALPGSFKNLLDWTVGGDKVYRKPVAWINTSSRGASNAHDSLRKVLGCLSTDIVEAACVQIPVTGDAVGPDGLIADPTDPSASHRGGHHAAPAPTEASQPDAGDQRSVPNPSPEVKGAKA
jgi:chromate reductase, NAD(P)H dehydrogenase (quinone)